jgi:signal transduction histidine kinase
LFLGSCLLLIAAHSFLVKQKIFETEFIMHKEKSRFLKKNLLLHDFSNSIMALVWNAQKSKEAEIDRITKHLQELLIIASDDEDKSEMRLNKIIGVIVQHVIIKYPDIKIKTDIPEDFMVSAKYSIIMSSLLVVISNAMEANPTTVGIFKNENKIIIEDNGCGFDVSKISLGFTTKKHGHGKGLKTSIDACKFENVEITISSEIGKGTKVIFDFSKAVKSNDGSQKIQQGILRRA